MVREGYFDTNREQISEHFDMDMSCSIVDDSVTIQNRKSRIRFEKKFFSSVFFLVVRLCIYCDTLNVK